MAYILANKQAHRLLEQINRNLEDWARRLVSCSSRHLECQERQEYRCHGDGRANGRCGGGSEVGDLWVLLCR